MAHIDHYHGGSFAGFNAGALRTANVANALAMSGNTVTIITGDRSQSAILDAAQRFDLHNRVSIHAGGPPIRRMTRWFPRRINPLARGIGRERSADLILIFAANPQTFRRLHAHSQRHGLALTVDVDEWMGPADFSRRSWMTLFPARYEWFMRRLPNLTQSALAISDTMREHLASAGASVLVVPPLHRPFGTATSRRDRTPGKTRLLLPGVRRGGMGKDRCSLQLVSEAIERSPQLAEVVSIDIVGGLEERESARIAARLGRSVELRDHGRIDWAQSRRLLLDADWLVALRDPAVRRLHYAFPSKVTEALVAGTPVIANDYSDMRHYLDSDLSGILVERLDPQSVAKALELAASRRPDRDRLARAAQGLYAPAAVADSLAAFLLPHGEPHATAARTQTRPIATAGEPVDNEGRIRK